MCIAKTYRGQSHYCWNHQAQMAIVKWLDHHHLQVWLGQVQPCLRPQSELNCVESASEDLQRKAIEVSKARKQLSWLYRPIISLLLICYLSFYFVTQSLGRSFIQIHSSMKMVPRLMLFNYSSMRLWSMRYGEVFSMVVSCSMQF